MSTIAVIGASGQSGQAFVSVALGAGHHIRAGIHNQNSLPPHEQLEVIKIDATEQKDLVRLLEGSDVVVSLIGHAKNSPANLQTDTMIAVVAAMKNPALVASFH